MIHKVGEAITGSNVEPVVIKIGTDDKGFVNQLVLAKDLLDNKLETHINDNRIPNLRQL